MAKIDLEKALMAIGFIVGGIGMARTFGDLPGDLKRCNELIKKKDDHDQPSEETEE